LRFQEGAIGEKTGQHRPARELYTVSEVAANPGGGGAVWVPLTRGGGENRHKKGGSAEVPRGGSFSTLTGQRGLGQNEKKIKLKALLTDS